MDLEDRSGNWRFDIVLLRLQVDQFLPVLQQAYGCVKMMLLWLLEFEAL